MYAEQLLNSMKISKFSEELEALGPPPSDLEIESLNISKRRKSLNLLIDAANVPFLAANAMLKRTDFLIDEINAIMREKLTRKLFSFGASPLDFTFWSPAFREFLDFFGRMKRETFEIIGSQTQRKLLVQKFPLILLFTALIFLGFFIHLKGVVFNTVERFGQRTSVKFVPAIKVGLSGISFAILFSSVLILIEMLKFSGLFGFHGTGLLNAMSTIAIVIITGKWLSKSLLFCDSVLRASIYFMTKKSSMPQG